MIKCDYTVINQEKKITVPMKYPHRRVGIRILEVEFPIVSEVSSPERETGRGWKKQAKEQTKY